MLYEDAVRYNDLVVKMTNAYTIQKDSWERCVAYLEEAKSALLDLDEARGFRALLAIKSLSDINAKATDDYGLTVVQIRALDPTSNIPIPNPPIDWLERISKTMFMFKAIKAIREWLETDGMTDREVQNRFIRFALKKIEEMEGG